MRTDITSDPARPGRTPPEPELSAAVQENLHPVVYTAIIALALWLVVSAWVFFGGADYDGITLVVVTGLFLVAIGIPVRCGGPGNAMPITVATLPCRHSATGGRASSRPGPADTRRQLP